MASESREDPGLGVDVPSELDEWLEEQAASLGVGRNALVVQILSSYHAAATLDGQLNAAELLSLDVDDFVDVETAVEEEVDETVAERLDGLIAERLDEAVAQRLDDVESEFQGKIEDVRERVVQVKREMDGKAPATHTHDELDAIDARVDVLARDLEALRDELPDRLDEQESTTTALTDRIDDAADKLDRVAWVVSDLKDEASGRDAHEQAVDRIKRAAAQEGFDTADCERCDETVHLGLLTDPQCPHCHATVSDVRPAGGLLRKKARLVAASQLESGEETDR